MKKLLLPILFLQCLFTTAQEFETHENGLIYSSKAMTQLRNLVDMENQQFRVCELNKTFLSFEQTKGMVFALEEVNIETLKRDLLSNIGLKEFLKKYQESKNYGDKLLTKVAYSNYEGENIVRIKEQPEGYQVDILADDWLNSRYGHWAWDFSNPKYVRVIYFAEDFKTKPLPNKYGRMIQYSECLIDTTSQIFMANASTRRSYFLPDSLKVKQANLRSYIEQKLGETEPDLYFAPDMDEEDAQARIKSYREWQTAKEDLVNNKLSTDTKFLEHLNAAYHEAVELKNSNEELERYVAKFLSPKQALVLKRNRIVVGQCSMDNSPRIHAMNIAQLAGEAVEWDIFLRAHLNVLNDRMDRVSDGSWAQEGRKTYIKELEELDINVMDLIFGIALRSHNVAAGHYYGTIYRLGRAMAESRDVKTFESELPHMISDSNLDDFNRMLMFYLYDNLTYNLDTSEDKLTHKEQRMEAMALLPGYLHGALTY
nr:hypothetical protein [Allomuricauda sp.]